jgi:hypothetical protein
MATTSRTDQTRVDLQDLLRQPATDFSSFHVPEPSLVFGNGQLAPDPKLGLRAYGPCLDPGEEPVSQIRVGVIGTGQTIDMMLRWLELVRSEVTPDVGSKVDPFLFPSFPGMTESPGFNCDLSAPRSISETIPPGEIARCLGAETRDLAVDYMGRAISERLDVLGDKDKPPNIVVIALPNTVRDKAGSGRRRAPRRRGSTENAAQMVLAFLDEKRPESASRTLHRVIKAEGMRHGLPTQLAWEPTLTGGAGVQDAGTRAWNFCTALYYKAGGLPWRAAGLAPDTCYIGISFFRSIYDASALHTSMAQAFSDRGEGFVLRGATFDWDRRQGPPVLPPDLGKRLMAQVIDQYQRHHGRPPARVVVHKSSGFGEPEMDGMHAGVAGVPYVDFLAVRRSAIRFLRVGEEPPLRGSVVQIDDRRYIVYTRGYVPFLKLYPGLRIPRPLDIVHARGGSSIRDLLTELFALTRLNWNSADFASAEPITLAFSRRIGLILSELPADVIPHRSFRFYM